MTASRLAACGTEEAATALEQKLERLAGNKRLPDAEMPPEGNVPFRGLALFTLRSGRRLLFCVATPLKS